MATGMMIGPAKTIERARKYTSWKAGLCLNYVCQMCTGGRGLGVYAPSATHAWNNAKRKHTTGTPPAGAFVFFSTSRHQWGHVGIALGNGKIRHTWGNVSGRAKVVETTHSWVTGQGYKYLGWTEDLYGQRNVTTTAEKHPYPGHVHSRKQNNGQSRTSSHKGHVRTIQRGLNKRGKKVAVDGAFGPATEAAVKAVQRDSTAAGPADGVVGRRTWPVIVRGL